MSGESITDLTSYLDTAAKSTGDGNEKGQYFVDQATGQYYYQAADGDTMTVVSAPTATAGMSGMVDGGKTVEPLLLICTLLMYLNKLNWQIRVDLCPMIFNWKIRNHRNSSVPKRRISLLGFVYAENFFKEYIWTKSYISCVIFFSEGSSLTDSNQVVMNTGGDQYQTVTIVPSDGHTGEVKSWINSD